MLPPRLARSSGPPTASRQGEKTTASQDQARQSSTNDGTGDSHAVDDEGRVKLWHRGAINATNNVSADPQPIGRDASIAVISCPALEIGEAEGEGRSGWHNRLWGRQPEKVPIR